jgi:hypothetical protein
MAVAHTLFEKVLTLAGMGQSEEVLDNGLSVLEYGHGHGHGLGFGDLVRPWTWLRLLGTGDIRNILFWLGVAIVLVLFGELSVSNIELD